MILYMFHYNDVTIALIGIFFLTTCSSILDMTWIICKARLFNSIVDEVYGGT